MINKILWASDGSKNSNEALKCVELLAAKFKASVIGLNVIDTYYNVVEILSSDEKDKFSDWIDETLKSNEGKKLKVIADNFTAKKIGFQIKIETGIPHREILRIARGEKVDLVALGKDRTIDRFILGGTAIKVIRQSPIPVLIPGEIGKCMDIKRILVPIDISHGSLTPLKYALGLSKRFDAVVYLLNIVEVGRFDFLPEVVERITESSLGKIEEDIREAKLEGKMETYVRVAKNAWVGIVKFADQKNIDLIVMTTFGGTKFREEFIGSIAEKVIQEAHCPVIVMRPHLISASLGY
ncbi:MAG TPA: universal stress protein [Thermodesulfobacteriota bacterium]|nr:universal stress protein [Thermodesulfobacteriota bacterium]